MLWIPRVRDHVSYHIYLLENNPSIFFRLTVAGEEKGDEVVCSEVNQVRFTAVVLDFGEDFKIYCFLCGFFVHSYGIYNVQTKVLRKVACVFFSGSQQFFLHKFYIKIFLLNPVFAPKT